jgi:hypothetical protein
MARARRLLEEQPEAPERGFLLVADAHQAVAARDFDTAGRLAREALATGEQHGLSTVVALARFLCGFVAVHQGRTAEGLRDVDEAMLPVQAGQVAPEWVGSLYCDTMSLCFELLDLPRAQRWTTLTERWLAGQTPAVMFTGICRVHRAQLRVVHGEWARAEEEARQAAADLEPLDVAVARAEAEDWGLGNARFEVRDVASLDGTGTFGLITAFDAIHDQAHPATVLEQIQAHLDPDGDFLMVDMYASSNVDANLELPWAPYLYAVSTMHCMTVSLSLGGDGLGTAWGTELRCRCWRTPGSETSGWSGSRRTSSTATTWRGGERPSGGDR